jgi:TPR repeat protein/transglutaminase-like putative cysteine protease
MIARILWPLLVLLITAAGAPASAAAGPDSTPAWIDPGWRRTVVRYAVTFDERGLSTTVFDFEILALDAKGAATISQRVLPYDSYFNDLTVSNLATVKPDGRIIAVDERAILDQPGSSEISSPYFDEKRNRVITYAEVEAGDKIRGRAIYRDKRPRFPGEFERFWSQSLDQPPEVIELTLDGPASKPLQIAARNVEHGEERSGDRIIHHVHIKHDLPERGAADIGDFDRAQRFEASSFADYPALAAALNARNAPMAMPDGTLRAFAAKIVGDTATTVGKVERLHNWVAQNIRYVGIGFEDGGLSSQPAAAVLASRYGDSKAHATLLKALLVAQGIEANLVAVNIDPHYTLTEVATQNFDHAIVYVPQLDQYLDPTASQLAFGALPVALTGKPALNIDTGKLQVIPVMSSARFALASDTDATLAPDGRRQGRTLLSGLGLGAALGREAARRLERGDRRHLANEMIAEDDLSGTGDYIFSDPRKLSDEYDITATFRLEPVKLAAPLRLPMEILSDHRLPLLQLITGGVRDQPFRCQPLQYWETVSLHLPDGINLSRKQAPVAYRAGFDGETAYGTVHGRIEVDGEVVLDGRTVRSQAHVQVSFDKAVCPADFIDAIKRGLSRFNEFRRADIGLTPKPVGYVVEISPAYNLGVRAFDNENYELALTWLRPLAEQGHADAQSYLGAMYEHGHGVALDHQEAARWFLLAAAQGDAFGQTSLGDLYEKGLGVPRDDKRAVEWFAKAADLGDQQAQSRLATMYRDGRGVARDFKQALKWYSLAADQGSAWSQMNIGLLYLYGGHGLAKEYGQAIDWFRKAADNGNSDAKFDLGWAYETGAGVHKDREQAVEWYRKAAEQGHREAQNSLNRLSGESENGGWPALAEVVMAVLRLVF